MNHKRRFIIININFKNSKKRFNNVNNKEFEVKIIK